MRLTLVQQDDGRTRLHGCVSYAPRRFTLWLADRLFLRRSIAGCLQGALANVAKSFEPAPEPAMAEANLVAA